MSVAYEQKTPAQIEAEQVELFWKREAEAEASMIASARRERKFDRVVTAFGLACIVVPVAVFLIRVLFS